MLKRWWASWTSRSACTPKSFLQLQQYGAEKSSEEADTLLLVHAAENRIVRDHYPSPYWCSWVIYFRIQISGLEIWITDLKMGSLETQTGPTVSYSTCHQVVTHLSEHLNSPTTPAAVLHLPFQDETLQVPFLMWQKHKLSSRLIAWNIWLLSQTNRRIGDATDITTKTMEQWRNPLCFVWKGFHGHSSWQTILPFVWDKRSDVHSLPSPVKVISERQTMVFSVTMDFWDSNQTQTSCTRRCHEAKCCRRCPSCHKAETERRLSKRELTALFFVHYFLKEF